MTAAAFFDMDNTLLRVESGMSWTRFLYGRGELSKRMVAKAIYWTTLYKLAVLDMETVFTRLCQDLEGDLESDMLDKCARWYQDHLAREVAPLGLRAVAEHKRRGELVVLATGSTQYAAGPVARGADIDHVLSSRLEVERGRFTGRAAALCFGHHKVRLAEAWALEHGVELAASTFYSDSYNDLPLLECVGHAVAVNPDPRLRRHATRAGWRIERWA
ncbi:MAG: HAD family hydrolase [Myxococcales bacterium]|nr:HAD family hydrolase [Myxococcales bacterium]